MKKINLDEALVQRIVRLTAKKFRSFGGGKVSDWNPITQALKDSSPQFAAGVFIEEVVRFVLFKGQPKKT